MTVADASPILQELGVTAIWHIFGQAPDNEPVGRVGQASIADEFIYNADPYSPNTVSIIVAPKPVEPSDLNLPRSTWDDYYRSINRLDQGC